MRIQIILALDQAPLFKEDPYWSRWWVAIFTLVRYKDELFFTVPRSEKFSMSCDSADAALEQAQKISIDTGLPIFIETRHFPEIYDGFYRHPYKEEYLTCNVQSA